MRRAVLAMILGLECAGIAGAEPAGTPFDLQGHIDAGVRAGRARIVVPPGCYRMAPVDRQHLVLRNLRDLEIVADGVELICTETTRAITITRCTNLTVRGLTIDYDPLPFTQGRIAGLPEDGRVHDIELFDGYPPAAMARNSKYEIFRPDTRTLRCDDRYPDAVEAVGTRRLRVTFRGGRPGGPEQVGDLVVIGAEDAPHGSAPHAVECSQSAGVRLEDIALFASNCFGFLETDCDGNSYMRCRIDRRPPGEDIVARADPRLRSLNADAFHSKHALRGPSYVACTARFMGDDAVNINGDYHMVMAADGARLRVLAKHAMNIRHGDPVEVVSYTGERLPDARAVAVEPDGAIRDDERAFLARQSMDERLKSARGALSRAYTLTLDRAVELPRGSVLCAANRTGRGFRVKDCTFGFNRSRGILIKASGGEVAGNRLEGCRMSAILVCPEYWWLEAGSSNDLAIRDNTITACGDIAIRIEAEGGAGTVAPAGAHRTIAVTGNAITQSPLPGILVTSTTGLRMHDNRLDLSGARPIPRRMREAGLDAWRPITTLHCDDAQTNAPPPAP